MRVPELVKVPGGNRVRGWEIRRKERRGRIIRRKRRERYSYE